VDDIKMPAVTIRNLSVETHRALKVRAAEHGRSTEAEIRDIIENAVRPQSRTRLGAELAAIGRQVGGVELNIARDKTPAGTVDFE
jgi:plasmid stability protein